MVTLVFKLKSPSFPPAHPIPLLCGSPCHLSLLPPKPHFYLCSFRPKALVGNDGVPFYFTGQGTFPRSSPAFGPINKAKTRGEKRRDGEEGTACLPKYRPEDHVFLKKKKKVMMLLEEGDFDKTRLGKVSMKRRNNYRDGKEEEGG